MDAAVFEKRETLKNGIAVRIRSVRADDKQRFVQELTAAGRQQSHKTANEEGLFRLPIAIARPYIVQVRHIFDTAPL